MTVLLARGYEGTRIAEIAREAGLTSGAIYNHFASKADLLTAAISEQGPDAISDAMRSGELSTLDAFRQIGRILPHREDSLAQVLIELVAASARDPEVARVVRNEFLGKERDTADMIRIGQDAGEVSSAFDAEVLARFTTMLALGSALTAALELKPVDDQGWAALIDHTLNAFTPQGDPP